MNTTEIIAKLNDFGADTQDALNRFVGDEQLYCNCILSFFQDENMEQLKYALDRNDFESAFSAAHTLKGLTGNLGLTPLYNRLCFLVELLRNNERDDILSEQEAVFSQHEKLKQILFSNN